MKFQELNIPFLESVNQELLKHSRLFPSSRTAKIICGGNPNYISIKGSFTEGEGLFGLSPKMSFDKIRDELIAKSSSPLLCEQRFIEYIMENRGNWSWGEKIGLKNKASDIALLSKCVLAMTHEFSVSINCESLEYIEEFLDCLDKEYIYYQFIDTAEMRTVKIHGRLGSSQCLNLSKKYYLYEDKDKKTLVVKEYFDTLQNKMDWDQLYRYLGCYHSLYSGVIPDLRNLSLLGSNNANKRLSRINVKTARTTYATVLGMGHPKLTYDEGKLYSRYSLIHHPFLKSYFSDLEQVNEEEALLQKALFHHLHSTRDEKLIEKLVNNYLNKSYFPHIISIAGNVLTMDEYLLYTQRGMDVEHEGLYSCSLTGYGEIYDDAVEFYRDSVIDDKPTIQFGGEYDFAGEFSREARAELGVSTSPGDWRYLGLMISGKPEASYNKTNNQPGTIDFEVLGQGHVNYSLENVLSLQEKSIEKDENEGIYGIKVTMFKNKKERTDHFLNNFLDIVIRNKDLIILTSLIYPFILSIVDFLKLIFNTDRETIKELINKIEFKSSLEFFINIFLIILFLLNSKKVLQDRSQRKSIIAYEEKMSRGIAFLKVINKKLPQKGTPTYLYLGMVYMYVYTLTSNNRGKGS